MKLKTKEQVFFDLFSAIRRGVEYDFPFYEVRLEYDAATNTGEISIGLIKLRLYFDEGGKNPWFYMVHELPVEFFNLLDPQMKQIQGELCSLIHIFTYKGADKKYYCKCKIYLPLKQITGFSQSEIEQIREAAIKSIKAVYRRAAQGNEPEIFRYLTAVSYIPGTEVYSKA